MIEVRFHGRGGQGAKIASRILGRSGFLAGLYAQDFALFGAERRGAPVVSCTRLSEHPIHLRGYVDNPDVVLVLDDSLLSEYRAQVFHGVNPNTPVLIDSTGLDESVSANRSRAAQLIRLDLSGITQRLIGHPIVSAAIAAVAAKCVRAIAFEQLTEAIRLELAEFGVTAELIEKNVRAAREAYELTPALVLHPKPEPLRQAATLEALPYLTSAQFASPAIRHRANAILSRTGSWRTERPEIEPGKCKRCFLCYLYCPDTAIRLDQDNLPHVDYEHCKGCMICYEECPTDAISRRLEA